VTLHVDIKKYLLLNLFLSATADLTASPTAQAGLRQIDQTRLEVTQMTLFRAENGRAYAFPQLFRVFRVVDIDVLV
jgi:hypothetical protein